MCSVACANLTSHCRATGGSQERNEPQFDQRSWFSFIYFSSSLLRITLTYIFSEIFTAIDSPINFLRSFGRSECAPEERWKFVSGDFFASKLSPVIFRDEKAGTSAKIRLAAYGDPVGGVADVALLQQGDVGATHDIRRRHLNREVNNMDRFEVL